MKKILFITRPIAPPWDEASKNFAYNLAREVAKNNPDLEIHLLTKGQLVNLPENIIQHPIYTSSKNDLGFRQKVYLLRYLFLNAYKFDIAHLIFTPTKFNSWILKRILKSNPLYFLSLLKTKMTNVIVLYNTITNAKSEDRGNRTKIVQTIATLREDLFSDKEIKKLMFGDVIVTYSNYAKNKLKSLGLDNTRQIYPGIDLENYRPRTMNRKPLAVNYIINFTGEYVRLNAMDDVIESFIEISQKIPQAKLSLAVRIKNKRDAIKKKEVVAKLKEKNILDRVAFYDDGKYNMADIYNLCDISVFPVHNMKGKFDIPLAVVEAMACEKPVILSDIPILQEFANKNNSATIKAGDISSLSITIMEFYRNPDKRSAIGKKAREYIKENFSIQKIAKKYSKIYQRL